MFKNKDFLIAGILALVLSFVLFGNGISGDFVLDDTIVIVGNPFIGGQLDGFWEIFINPYFAYQPRPGLYRPLTIASYAVNAFIFGQSPASFHVVNILLHALTSFLVFVLLYWVGSKDVPNSGADRGFSIRRLQIGTFFGFIFFMFLPIHVEAVTSIVGRAEILSLLFIIGALLASLSKKYILASGLFFLGLLSKEMAVAFLPIFLFLEFLGHKTDTKSTLKKLAYFVPSLAVYSILRYVALGEYFLKNDATPVYNPIKFAPFLSGLATSFKVFYLYLEKTFYPLFLSTDYSFNQIPLVNNPFVSVGAILGVIIFGLLVLLFFKTKNFLLQFGIIVFLVSYFVVSNWIFKTGTIMAERLMYTPSLGLALMVGSLLQARPVQVLPVIIRRIFYSFLLIILFFYGFLTWDRNKDWLNKQDLYKSAYAVAPKSVVNQTNMAYLDFIKGKHNEAADRLSEVLNVVPEHVPALNLAGQNYKKLGQYQKAEEFWKKVIGLRNDYLRAYLSLGVLYYENGYFKSAEKVLTDAINIYPRWSEVLFLALTQVGLEKPDEAIELINKHFSEEPAQKELKFALGWAHLNKGAREPALYYFNQVKDPKMAIDDFVKTFEDSKVIILGEY